MEQLLLKLKHSAIRSNSCDNRETEIKAHRNIFNTNSVNYPRALGGIFLQHLQLLCLYTEMTNSVAIPIKHKCQTHSQGIVTMPCEWV